MRRSTAAVDLLGNNAAWKLPEVSLHTQQERAWSNAANDVEAPVMTDPATETWDKA
jgi:hypothetical protein